MEEVKNKSGHSLGIAALITAIITFVLAVIPCVGIIAIIPGIISIILAAVGMSRTSGPNESRGVLTAGLIIGIIASIIAISQIFVVGKIAQKADKWPGGIQNIINDVQDNVIKDLEDSNVSIKVESNGEKIEINTSSDKKDKELQLEELEKGNTQINDSLKSNK